MISQEAFGIFYDLDQHCCVLNSPQQYESFKKIIEQYDSVVHWDFKEYEPETSYPIVVTCRVRTFPNETVFFIFTPRDTHEGKSDLKYYTLVEPNTMIKWAKEINDLEKAAREDYDKKNAKKKIKNRIFVKIDDPKKGKELYDLAMSAGYEVYPEKHYDDERFNTIEITKTEGEFLFQFSASNVYHKSEKDGKIVDIDVVLPIVRRTAEKKSGSGKQKTFGNYLFLGNNPFGSDADGWIKKQQKALKKFEPNTPREKEFANTLKSWISSGYSGAKVGPQLYKFKDDIKKFKDIFRPILNTQLQSGTRVYRGVTTLTDQTAQILSDKTTPDDYIRLNTPKGTYYLCKKPIKFTSESLVQSWTPDFVVAQGFSSDAMLMTKLDDSFYMNPKFMNAIFGEDENEVLHFDRDFKKPVYLMVDDDGMDRVFEDMYPDRQWKSKKTIASPKKPKANPFDTHVK